MLRGMKLLRCRAIVAAANHHVTTEIAAGLQDGRWGRAAGITITGIGHSIGGMMVITQQAAHRSIDEARGRGGNTTSVSECFGV